MAGFLHWPTTAVGCQLHLGHQAQMGQANPSVATEGIACAAMATAQCVMAMQLVHAVCHSPPTGRTVAAHRSQPRWANFPWWGVQHFQVMCGKKLIHNLVNENIGVPRKGGPPINLALFWGGQFLYCGGSQYQAWVGPTI